MYIYCCITETSNYIYDHVPTEIAFYDLGIPNPALPPLCPAFVVNIYFVSWSHIPPSSTLQTEIPEYRHLSRETFLSSNSHPPQVRIKISCKNIFGDSFYLAVTADMNIHFNNLKSSATAESECSGRIEIEIFLISASADKGESYITQLHVTHYSLSQISDNIIINTNCAKQCFYLPASFCNKY